MLLSRVAFIFFFSLFFTNLHAQIEFDIAPMSLYDGVLSSQKDCVLDMNGDHLDDIVIIINTNLIIFYQQLDGKFERKEYPIDGTLNAQWNVLGGDFNGDGFNDLAIGNDENLSFIMYNPDADEYTLTVNAEELFVQRSTGADIDLDGDLDVFSCNDIAINKIFENDGSGNFISNPSLLPTVDLAGNYSNVWCDYDNDGDQDLQISKCYLSTTSIEDPERINLLYRNNGDGSFTEVGESANMNDNAQSWVTNMQDFDNDGDFDAYIANHDIANRFLINDGLGNFTDTIASTNLDVFDLGALESFAYDFDNNGFIDILSDSEKRVWLNNGDLTFTAVATPMFMFANGGVGDLNNDGFLDIMVGSRLWLNKTNENNWIKVNTVGTETNINGIGARVELHGEWGMQVREVRAGSSYSTMSSLNTHFGIGSATSIDSLIVTWPNGLRSTKLNPSINTTHLAQEFTCIEEQLVLFEDNAVTLCEGEILQLNVPDLYENIVWNNGTDGPEILIETEGIYYATMINPATGCFIQSNEVSVEIFQEQAPSIFPSGDIEICNGDNLTLTATVQQDDFIWNVGETAPSLMVFEAGQYFVQSTSICSGTMISSQTADVTLVTPSAPIPFNVEIGSGDNVTFEVEGENILWWSSEEGGNVIETGPVFTTPFLTSDFTIWVSNSVETINGNVCISERVPFTAIISDVAEIFIELGISTFPNPASNHITIDIESNLKVQTISLVNSLGQEVIELNEVRNQNIMDINHYPSGNYYLKFETTHGTIAKSVLIKK